MPEIYWLFAAKWPQAAFFVVYSSFHRPPVWAPWPPPASTNQKANAKFCNAKFCKANALNESHLEVQPFSFHFIGSKHSKPSWCSKICKEITGGGAAFILRPLVSIFSILSIWKGLKTSVLALESMQISEMNYQSVINSTFHSSQCENDLPFIDSSCSRHHTMHFQ